MSRRMRCWTWCALVLTSACGDGADGGGPTGPGPAASFVPVVSNVVNGTGASLTGRVAADLSALEPVAYVSLAPGAMPDGISGVIRDLRTGESRAVTVVDGGFDPVAIQAAVGDTLTITISLSAGGVSLARAVVPASQPPRVVRTTPARGRTDVAINATMAVIFSEPVNPATVDTASFRLMNGGAALPGTIRPLAGSTVGVEFVPSAALAPVTGYVLQVSVAIADPSGDHLTAPVSVDFVTATVNASLRSLSFSVQPGNARALQPLSPALQIVVRDAAGALDQSFTGPVTLALVGNGGGGILGGDVRVNAVAGTATFPNVVVNSSGTAYQLVASAAGAVSGTSSAFDVVAAAAATESGWTLKGVLHGTWRLWPASAVLDGSLYVVGGWHGDASGWDFQPEFPVGLVESFDPVTQQVTTRAPMPTPRANLGVGVVNGILYAIGGLTGGTMEATVEAYDPSTNTWTTRAPLPEPRVDFGVAVADGKLYVIGGTTEKASASASVEAYDPATNTWSTRASLPEGRLQLGAGVVNGLVYVSGGLNYNPTSSPQFGRLTATDVYDPRTNAWTRTTAEPNWHSAPGLAAINGLLYVVGGYYVPDPNAVDAYDPATRTWRSVPPLHRTSITAVGAINGVLYAVGWNDTIASGGDTYIFGYAP